MFGCLQTKQNLQSSGKVLTFKPIEELRQACGVSRAAVVSLDKGKLDTDTLNSAKPCWHFTGFQQASV